MKSPIARKPRDSRDAARGLRLETLEGRELLATLLVTTSADMGPGSLRQALLNNAASSETNSIDFDIPGSGVRTISLLSPLPEVSNPAIIDGTSQHGYAGTPLIELNGANIFRDGVTPPTQIPNVNGLVLSGGASEVKGLAIDRFTGSGILTTRDGNTIDANFIGTDPTGIRSLGNGGDGITVRSRGNTIGGTTAASRNVLSGNLGSGIFLDSSGSLPGNNIIVGNDIGTDVAGSKDVGNARGGILAISSGNTIGGANAGQANTIAYNGNAGVQVGYYSFYPTSQNRISQNSIFNNSGLGIDLGGDGVTVGSQGGSNFGANKLQSFPTLTSIYQSGGSTMVEGSLRSSPSTSFTVEFFTNDQVDPSGYGEGRTFLFSKTYQTDSTGFADLTSTLPMALTVGQLITTTATDSSGNTSEFSRAIGVASTSQADLSLSPSESSPVVQAGIAHSYRYTVTNNGPSRATNVVATDTLPAGATFLSSDSTQGTVNASGGSVVVNLGTIESGLSASFTLTFSIPTPGPVVNRVTVAADQGDPTQPNNTITQNYQVAPASPVSLDLSGSVTPDSARVGDLLTYTFLVRSFSFGNPATGVVISDPLPSGLEFVSAQSSQGSVVLQGNVVTANLGSLNSGANTTLTVVVRATQPGPISNTATVAANETDVDVTNNAATVGNTIALAPAADLAVLITEAPQPAIVGQGFSYVILVGNTGTAPATGVTLTNLLPDASTILGIQPSQGTVSVAGNLLTASLGDLAPGALAAVTIVLRPGAPGFLVDYASVAGDQTDFNIVNNYSGVAAAVLADTTPPAILDQKLSVANNAINGIVLTFNKALDPTLSTQSANYQILDLGTNPTASTAGTPVPIGIVAYDPASRGILITPASPLAFGHSYKLVVNGVGAPGIVDTVGNIFGGIGGGAQGSSVTLLFGRGITDVPVVQVGVPTPAPAIPIPVTTTTTTTVTKSAKKKPVKVVSPSHKATPTKTVKGTSTPKNA